MDDIKSSKDGFGVVCNIRAQSLKKVAMVNLYSPASTV
jgi:hypothetical protein